MIVADTLYISNHHAESITGIILHMRLANERWRYIVMSPLIGWAYTWCHKNYVM